MTDKLDAVATTDPDDGNPDFIEIGPEKMVGQPDILADQTPYVDDKGEV
jgi:hypothetical protein